MVDVLHRTTLEYLLSVSTPDYPTANWIHDPDLSGVVGVDKKYWKITGDTVSEMSSAEKDAAYLTQAKIDKIAAIDGRTNELIAAGFTYDSQTFSLSSNAQINWVGLKTFEALMTWPVNVATIDSNEYSLTQANLNAFVTTGTGTVQAHLDSGRALKVSVNAATTLAGVDAVVDAR